VTHATFGIEIAGDRCERVLVLSGEMDLAAVPRFGEALKSVCADGAQEVVLDLRGLDFMDSAGLRAILVGQGVCTEHGCEYFIDPAIPRALRRLFAMTRAGEHLAFKARRDVFAAARRAHGQGAAP
jgi:anti-anti-sigma factor